MLLILQLLFFLITNEIDVKWGSQDVFHLTLWAENISFFCWAVGTLSDFASPQLTFAELQSDAHGFHMCVCVRMYAGLRGQTPARIIYTHTHRQTCYRAHTHSLRALISRLWSVLLCDPLKGKHENVCCAWSKGLFGAVARFGSMGPSQ